MAQKHYFTKNFNTLRSSAMLLTCTKAFFQYKMGMSVCMIKV